MHIEVRVKFASGPPKVVRVRESAYEVFINERPVQGKANQAIVRLIAEHLGVARTRVRIVRGQRSRDKYLHIL